MTPDGHLRFLGWDEYDQYVKFYQKVQPGGMRWLTTRLGVLVEVLEGSMEHHLCLISSYQPTPDEIAEWPTSALYFAAENYLLTKNFQDLIKLLLRHEGVAKLFLSAEAYGGQMRLSSRNLEKAQNLVRVLYAAGAARAALREIGT